MAQMRVYLLPAAGRPFSVRNCFNSGTAIFASYLSSAAFFIDASDSGALTRLL